jgi:F1F0 ATPase subunit 2
MNETLSLAAGWLAGMLLGAFFFGGLWWTVRRGVSSNHPARWFFGSLLLRTGIVVLGFYFILGDDWRRLLAGLLGFIAARLIAMQLTRETKETRHMAQEAGHAS